MVFVLWRGALTTLLFGQNAHDCASKKKKKTRQNSLFYSDIRVPFVL
jgi:hypothetical protein